MQPTSITINDLVFTYPDGHAAIDHLSLKVAPGECIALVGANGAGKSTLFHLLTGILFPTEGGITIGDTRVEKKTLRDIRRLVGLVFQNPDDQLFTTRVSEDIAFGPQNMGLSSEAVDARVTQALTLLGIEKLRDRMPAHLSIGEKRMVAVASVLSMSPEVILFDEPSSFLDPWARRRLMETISAMPQTRIIATHDLDMAEELCDRAIVLREGACVADGACTQILSDAPLLENCHLEMPFKFQRCSSCSHGYEAILS